jgi:hypothetical protein
MTTLNMYVKICHIRFFTDNIPARNYAGYAPAYGINRDAAQRLRTDIGVSYKTLIPSNWDNAERQWTGADFSTSKDSLRNFVTLVAGMSHEAFRRYLYDSYTRRLVATAFSSFAVLFYDKTYSTNTEQISGMVSFEEEAKTADFSKAQTVLVSGYGFPYGVSYNQLSEAQSFTDQAPNSTPIYMGSGVWMRFIHRIPMVSDKIMIDSNLYNNHWYMYFAGNGSASKGSATGKYVDVKGFVLGEAMLNFSLFPIPSALSIPDVILSRDFGYLNRTLYHDITTFYRDGILTGAREVYDLKRNVKDWKFEKLKMYLHHISFGEYSHASGAIAPPVEVPLVITDMINHQEQRNEEATQERVNRNDPANTERMHSETENRMGDL